MTDKATDVTVTQADEKRADDWAMMLGRMGGVILDQSQRRGLAAQFAAHRTAHSGEGRSKVTFVRCASCSGEFDEGEWDADTRCPECEQPKEVAGKRAVLLSGEGRSNGAGEDVERLVRIFRSLPLHGDAGCDKLTDDEWRQVALAALTDISLSAPQGEVERGSAIDDIAAERRRQIEAEGWTPEHDDAHSEGDLSRAAACYAAHASAYQRVTVPLSAYQSAETVRDEYGWPWAKAWWKPSTPRRDLVKAGALIVAEIERIDRAALAQPKGGDHG